MGNNLRLMRYVKCFGFFLFASVFGLALTHMACSNSAPAVVAIIHPASGPFGGPNGGIDPKNPPRHLSPMKEGVWTYDIIDGQGRGGTVTETLTLDPTDPTAPWRRTISADNVISHLRLQPDGSIVMTANEILDKDVINTFDPPQTILPAPQALGLPFSMTSKVVTNLRSGPKIQVSHGTSALTLTPLGTETIDTPAGTFKCQVIQLTLNLNFTLGSVQSTATLDYADGVGLVAETYNEKTSSLFATSNVARKTILRSCPH